MALVVRISSTQRREAGTEGVVVGALTSKKAHIMDATMQGEDMSFRHD